MKLTGRIAAPALFLLAGGFHAVSGQTPGGAAPAPHVRAGGQATVSTRPDQVKIDIGVVSQAQTARQAAEANAAQLTGMLAAIRKELGPKADIKTVGYSLSPQMRYPRDGGQPVITGYRASNVVQVTMNQDEMGKAGVVLDVATAAGANEVRGIQFMLRDEQAARAQALRDAARKARANAEAMASALGLRIVRVVSVVEGEAPQVQPVMRMAAMADASGAPTPVEAGTIEVHATVSLTAEVAP